MLCFKSRHVKILSGKCYIYTDDVMETRKNSQSLFKYAKIMHFYLYNGNTFCIIVHAGLKQHVFMSLGRVFERKFKNEFWNRCL